MNQRVEIGRKDGSRLEGKVGRSIGREGREEGWQEGKGRSW